MQIKLCSKSDVSRLAEMNKHLIEDEKSDNPMGIPELEERMNTFLSGDYDAYLFAENGKTIGYALVRRTSSPLYLRQFFIDREYRRMHYGREAFQELMKTLRTDTIDIDVLPWNEPGLAFWKSMGFTETCISMRFHG